MIHSPRRPSTRKPLTRLLLRMTMLLVSLAFLTSVRANAALMADPVKLYAQMKAVFEKGTAQGWTFYNQQEYLSTIFNAGRAYSLPLPNDPGYANLALLTVDMAS